MRFRKHEWNKTPILVIQHKVLHFNELNKLYRKRAPKKKAVTWGQAYRNAIRYYEKQVDE
jgi:hypothetical protein